LARFKHDPTELVVLSVLAEGPRYGYAITKEVAAKSEGEMRVPPSALYPLLAKLEKGGLVAAQWEEVKSERAPGDAPGRRRKWYRLTPKGKRQLEKRIHAHQTYMALMQAFIGDASDLGARRKESP
jgi:PadR family transcriptional regulator